MLKEQGIDSRPAEEAPFVSRDEEPKSIMIEVDGSKVSNPYHFLSYPTVKKLGVAMTTLGAAFLCISGVTMNVFEDLDVFYIPGLAVILAGSFGVSASKVKRRKLKQGLVIVTVVLVVCAIAGTLYSLVTACQIIIKKYDGKIMVENIMFVLRIGIAVVILTVAGMLLGITMDSLLCGRHRPGYSTMIRVVYKAEDIEMDQLDGVNHNMHKSHDHSRHHGDHHHHHGNRSPCPHHHGHHSPRPNNSPRHHGNHSPRFHGDRSPRPNSPHRHGDGLSPLTGHDDDKHHDKRDGQHKHHYHHRHQHEYITSESKHSGLEHMASLEHSTDHKPVKEHHTAWDMVNKM